MQYKGVSEWALPFFDGRVVGSGRDRSGSEHKIDYGLGCGVLDCRSESGEVCLVLF